MPKKIDLTNQHFGEWTVLREATKEEKKNRPGAFWVCQCSCGTIRILNGQTLRDHESSSCGCKTSERLSQSLKGKNVIDLTGQRFGRLTVLGRDEKIESQYSGTNTYWRCQCDCGNIVSVVRSSLTMGKTQSCGCLQKEVAANHLSELSTNNYIDETGNRYGKLTVLYRTTPHSTTQGARWHCKCDCGNECDVMGTSLRQQNTSSCGCLKSSKGEFYITQLLSNANVSFVHEFPIMINNTRYRFDFAIFNNSQLIYIIEFDGVQHFTTSSLFGGIQELQRVQASDLLKNQWCKENNIPLIRIPYTRLNDLCLEDLQLETTQFLLK